MFPLAGWFVRPTSRNETVASVTTSNAGRNSARVTRTPAEEREWCLLQWTPDFSPSTAAEQAQALWETRPPGTAVNVAANRELWADRGTEDLLQIAAKVSCPVRMLFGADDPRPWSASDSLLGVLPDADRIVLEHTGHAPWAEQPGAAREAVLDALRPAER